MILERLGVFINRRRLAILIRRGMATAKEAAFCAASRWSGRALWWRCQGGTPRGDMLVFLREFSKPLALSKSGATLRLQRNQVVGHNLDCDGWPRAGDKLFDLVMAMLKRKESPEQEELHYSTEDIRICIRREGDALLFEKL